MPRESPRRVRTACGQRRRDDREELVDRFGEPGKLTISVMPAMPEIPRERIPCGVTWTAAQRIASAKPGASRESTARVASGVMSSGVSPVPPVVKIEVAAVVDEVVAAGPRSARSRRARPPSPRPRSPPPRRAPASAGPDSSSASRRETDVETVRTAVRMAQVTRRPARARAGRRRSGRARRPRRPRAAARSGRARR